MRPDLVFLSYKCIYIITTNKVNKKLDYFSLNRPVLSHAHHQDSLMNETDIKTYNYKT